MYEVEFTRCKLMLGIFIHLYDKFTRDSRLFVDIRDEDVKASMRFVIVVRRDIGSLDITNDKPKLFSAR